MTIREEAREAAKIIQEKFYITNPELDVILTITNEAINKAVERETKRYREWVNDLQSGMYINCVYCGHQYGPNDEIPESMADVLKEHIEICPDHPMSKLKEENERLKNIIESNGLDGPIFLKAPKE